MVAVALTIAVPDRTGAARMLANYCAALGRRGHDPLVIHGPPPTDRAGRSDSIVADLATAGIETRPVLGLRRPLPLVVEREVARAAAGCAVIVGFNQRDRAAAARAGARLGIPAILAVQNQHNFWGPGPVPQLKRRFYRRAVRNDVTLSICASEVVERELIDMGVEPDRCVVVPNGVPIGPAPDPAARAERRAALGLEPARRVFLNVGRLDVQKGQDLLVEAWAAAGAGDRCARLLLAGGTSQGAQSGASAHFRAGLEAAIDRLGVGASVTLLGWRDDIAELLTATDVYVHPARWEGWPLAVMEAMAAARPVIMSDCAGPPRGHDPTRHGPIVPTGDVAALAAAIERLLDLDDHALTAMGDRGRRLVEEHYDLDHLGDRFVDHVEEVVEAQPMSR